MSHYTCLEGKLILSDQNAYSKMATTSLLALFRAISVMLMCWTLLGWKKYSKIYRCSLNCLFLCCNVTYLLNLETLTTSVFRSPFHNHVNLCALSSQTLHAFTLYSFIFILYTFCITLKLVL